MIARTIMLSALVLTGLSGCNSKPKEAELDANGNKIEYVYYTPTGSNLPIKVRKDQLNQTEADRRAQQDNFSKAQDRGRKTGPLNQ